jgi:hypothetical protein
LLLDKQGTTIPTDERERETERTENTDHAKELCTGNAKRREAPLTQ